MSSIAYSPLAMASTVTMVTKRKRPIWGSLKKQSCKGINIFFWSDVFEVDGAGQATTVLKS